MKISTDSWHFRLICYLDWAPKDSLCLYFWQCVGACLMLPLRVVVTTGAVAGLFFLAVSPFVGLFTDVVRPASYLTDVVRPASYLGAALWVIVLLLILREYREERGGGNDNLFVAYLAAKKERICPRIEFTEGKK